MATAVNPGQSLSPTEVSVDGDLVSSLPDTDQPSVQVRKRPTRFIIIEPVLAMFLAAYIPSSTLVSQFVYVVVSSRNNLTQLQAKTGQYLNGTDVSEICKSDQFEYIHELQNYVQSQAAELNMILNVSSALPAVLAVLYFGAISDRVGRKIPLILPIIGQLIKCTIYVLTLYFRLPLKLLILASVLEGLFGGLTTIMMSGMAYITDICEKTNRTFRITVLEVACGLSAALAQVLLGYAITYLGFLYPFYIIMGVHAINLLYVIFFVPEMRFAKKANKLVSPKHILRTFRLYTVDDGTGRRLKRLLCLGALTFCSMTVSGRWDPLTLFQLNSPLCFTSVLIGLNSAWIALSSQGGQIASVGLLYSRLHDVGLAILGCLSGIAYFILLAFTKSTAMMFASKIFIIFSFKHFAQPYQPSIQLEPGHS